MSIEPGNQFSIDLIETSYQFIPAANTGHYVWKCPGHGIFKILA